MLDRTSVIGGSYENGSAIFILYACVPEGNHVFFFHSCVSPRCSARIPFPGNSEENFSLSRLARRIGLRCALQCTDRGCTRSPRPSAAL